MLRRLSAQFRTLPLCRSVFEPNRFVAGSMSSHPSPLRTNVMGLSRQLASASVTSSSPISISRLAENVVSKKRVEDVMPIATGHEREELEAMLQGRKLLDINYPVGPFATKDAPAVIRSYYSKRIVGCPGGEGEDEHDVVWFWLEKGKPHECPVCSQFFVLEVVGPGGPPDGHDDNDDL